MAELQWYEIVASATVGGCLSSLITNYVNLRLFQMKIDSDKELERVRNLKNHYAEWAACHTEFLQVLLTVNDYRPHLEKFHAEYPKFIDPNTNINGITSKHFLEQYEAAKKTFNERGNICEKKAQASNAARYKILVNESESNWKERFESLSIDGKHVKLSEITRDMVAQTEQKINTFMMDLVEKRWK